MKRGLKRLRAYNVVERMFRSERQIRAAVVEAKADRQHNDIDRQRKSHISDPTAGKAIANMTPLKHVTLRDGYVVRDPETWLSLIDQVYSEISDNERKIVRLFYSGRSAISVSIECHVYESTVYRIRSETRHMATELACQYGLIKVV